MSTFFTVSYVVLWVFVIGQSLILVGLVRMVYQLQQSGVGNESASAMAGKEAPPFDAIDLAGRPVHSTSFAGHLTALLFVSTTCPACVTTLAETNALRNKTNGNVVVICKAGHDDCRRFAQAHHLDLPVIADEDDQISKLYDVSSVPTAVLINAHGRIQSYGYPMREEMEQAFEQESQTIALEAA